MSESISSIEGAIANIDVDTASIKTLMEYSIYILRKDHAKRTPKDIEVLRKYTSQVEFFRNISQNYPECHIELCKNLGLQIASPGQVLFEIGSLGTTFYIILKGKAEVYINIVKANSEGKEELESVKVSVLEEGKAFGELAVMERIPKPRKATIKITKDSECYLATLEREPYQKILKHIKLELESHLNFLKESFLFNEGWTKRQLMMLLKSFQREVYHRGHVVYKEGDPCDYVYFVKFGEVQCTKVIELPIDDGNYLIDDNNVLYPQEQSPPRKIVEMAILTPGLLFGEEEALQALRNRNQVSFELKKLLAKNEERPREFPLSNLEDCKKTLRNDIERSIIKRETTMTVKSITAEVWHIPAKTFFEQVDSHHKTLNNILRIIDERKQRREELTKKVGLCPSIFGLSNPQCKKSLNDCNSILSLTKQKKKPLNINQPDQIAYCNMLNETQHTNHSTLPNESFRTSSTVSKKFRPRIMRTLRGESFNSRAEGKKQLISTFTKGFKKFKSLNRSNPPSTKTIDLHQLSNSTSQKATPRNDDSMVKLQSFNESKVTSPFLSRTSSKIILIDNIFSNHCNAINRVLKKRESLKSGVSRISNKQDDIAIEELEKTLDKSVCVQKIVHANHSYIEPHKEGPLLSNQSQIWPMSQKNNKRNSKVEKQVNRRTYRRQGPSGLSNSCLVEQSQKPDSIKGFFARMAGITEKTVIRHLKKDCENIVGTEQKGGKKEELKSIIAPLSLKSLIQQKKKIDEELKKKYISINKPQPIHTVYRTILPQVENKPAVQKFLKSKTGTSTGMMGIGMGTGMGMTIGMGMGTGVISTFRTTFRQTVSQACSLYSIEASDVDDNQSRTENDVYHRYDEAK